MTSFGTLRRERTKVLDPSDPNFDPEHPDQSEIRLQSGTNKFASQKVIYFSALLILFNFTNLYVLF